MSQSAADGIKYAARISGVREVALHGFADLAFWRAALRPEGLVPYAAAGTGTPRAPRAVAGAAELAVSATSLRWKGLRFRELVINVAVGTGDDESRRGGFFLAHAFNSSPALAFAERTVFKTPYYRGAIALADAAPALIEAGADDQMLFSAAMAGPRAPAAVAPAAWSGPVFLPTHHPAGSRRRAAKFFVILSGEQATYPLDAADRIAISPSAAHPIFAQLIESGFAAAEWRIRRNAEHAKSRTYDRSFHGAESA